MNETNLLIIFGVGIVALWIMYFYITRYEKHKHG
jgi:hypothetical protein